MAKTALLFMPVLQFFDNNGTELNGGTLTFYEAGTTTLKDTYADSGKSVTNPNPITLDSAGRPDNSGSPIQIWLDGSYKLVVKDSLGNTIRTEDNLTALAEATGYAAKTVNYTVTTADYSKLINVDATAGNITISLPAAATAGAGFLLAVAKSDSGSNTVIIDPDGTEKINGATTLTLFNQYDIAVVESTGSAWIIRDQYYALITENATDFEIAKSVEITTGNFTITSGNVTLTNGDLTLTSGNLALTSGNISLTSGNVTLTSGNLTLSKGSIDATDEDARTNTVDDILTLSSTTTGTPAAGIGTGILVKAESADETPSDFGRMAFVADDVTAGSEDTYFTIQTRAAGAALSDSYKFKNTGTGNYLITGAPSAERTVTLPDTDISIATQTDQETATSVGALVTSGRQHFNPSAAKFWAMFVGTGTVTLKVSYNTTSITDNGTGSYTANIATDFSTGDWCYAVTCDETGAGVNGFLSSILAGSADIVTAVTTTLTLTDATTVSIIGFGDHA